MTNKKKIKQSILENLGITKKYYALKNLKNSLKNLKNSLSSEQKLSSNVNSKKVLVMYIINFIFSPKNTFLHITDIKGNLKLYYSAGLIDIKGKQKKNRILVITRLCKILKSIKNNFLKNKPIALHFNNVGSYRYFIVKNLKSDFYIKVIKNYQSYPYNGCRKKKSLRKRQRSKRINLKKI